MPKLNLKRFPVLALLAPCLLIGQSLELYLDNSFDDGSRHRHAPPDTTAWFTSEAASTVSVTDTGLRQRLGQSAMILTYLTEQEQIVSLAPGHVLRLTFDFSFQNLKNKGYLRVGLFDTSRQPRVKGDNFGTSNKSFSGALGYILNLNGLEVGESADLRRRQPKSMIEALMATTRAFWMAGQSEVSLNHAIRSDTAYTGILEIHRISGISVQLKSSITGPDGLVFETTSTDDTATLTTTFDTVGFMIQGMNGDAFTLHSIRVELSPDANVTAVMSPPSQWVSEATTAKAALASKASVNSPLVAPVNLSTIALDAFSDADLATGWSNHYPMPYYLAHISTLANSVQMDGPEKGWINHRVWRSPLEFTIRDPRPMEAVLNMAWFYASDRPWNPYFGDEALRMRLEAALDYYTNTVEENGLLRAVEGRHIGLRLGTSMFFTKFMGEILVLLENAPAFDADLYARMLDAQRRVLRYIFNSDLAVVQGRQFSNQYGNIFAGLYAYLALTDDAEIRGLANRIIPKVVTQFQSPAGFLYEDHSVDWGYSTGTHHSNIHMAWEYANRAGVDYTWLEEETRLWGEWFSYNAVPEPDFSYFALNCALEGRQNMQGFSSLYAPFAKHIPVFRAYLPNTFELEEMRAQHRRTIARTYPAVEALREGFSTFGPYALLHRNHFSWYPSAAQQIAARESLPMLARDHFIHQRVDNRWPLEVTFIRRPGYYAVFNAGEARNNVQTFGLGLLWHPLTGSVLQSQTRMSGSAAWGVRIEGTSVQEKTLPRVHYLLDDIPWLPQTGNTDLPDGELEIHFQLPGRGEKFLRFEEDRILVVVNPGGSFVEQIPVLVPRGMSLEITESAVRVPQLGGKNLVIRGEGILSVEADKSARWIGDKQVVTIFLTGERRFAYSLQIE
jgi:hypothetical protein